MPQSPKLPFVHLDSTTAHLYKGTSPRNSEKRIGLVHSGTSSVLNLSAHFRRNSKYPYQDSPFNSVSVDDLTKDNGELQRSISMKYLSLVPQRESFISGSTAVILFNVDLTEQQMVHDWREAERTLEILNPKQRPELVFCPGPARIPLRDYGIDMLAYKMVLDDLESFPLTVDLEKHWFVNSKVALAQSGLPTPKCKIVEIAGYAPTAEACCEGCVAGDARFIPASCNGVRGTWPREQTAQVLGAVSSYPLPFVLKNQPTFGRAGTWVVNSKKDWTKLSTILRAFSTSFFRQLLMSIIT